MIEADKNEMFPITVTLLDEEVAQLVASQTVSYDIRTMDDLELSPPVSGTLTESTVEGGIYKAQLSLPEAGTYICYATCSGFFTSSEEIVINEVSYTDAAKYNLPHNLLVTDVLRTTADVDMTPSQTARNVPEGKTDYIVTVVKRDSDVDWSDPVSSGISYAHYAATTDTLPYMMGGAY
jgi:hypothetical protein